ncbi:hypothetical protein EA58_02580 [Photobacterium galatheae]|uniref:Uncharacterized protein n=1 Tax=Photobacterium galatheae TaxID=1654360 RepID=A0A066RRW8_9GAMM|nr:hypothetical protein EA58_02580 [Photobacterium galatheae]
MVIKLTMSAVCARLNKKAKSKCQYFQLIYQRTPSQVVEGYTQSVKDVTDKPSDNRITITDTD